MAIAVAYANIAEGDWVGGYCQQKSAAMAEKDYWAEHSITHTLHDWGFGSDDEDRDFKRFKKALNAHIDGKMMPLFGFSAGYGA